MTRKYLRDSVTGRPYDPTTKKRLDEQARDAVRVTETAPEHQVLTHEAAGTDYRKRIHAQQYINEQREEFPDEPWRYVPTALSKGLKYADLNDRELSWLIDDMQTLLVKMEAWTGTPYPPEQFAERRAILAEMQAAQRG